MCASSGQSMGDMLRQLRHNVPMRQMLGMSADADFETVRDLLMPQGATIYSYGLTWPRLVLD